MGGARRTMRGGGRVATPGGDGLTGPSTLPRPCPTVGVPAPASRTAPPLLGLVVPVTGATLLTDPALSRLLRGIAEQCARRGADLFIFHDLTERGGPPPTLARLSFLDGLILAPSPAAAPLLADLYSHHCPLVLLAAPEASPTASTVALDHEATAAAATRHLIALGRRRVALVAAPQAEGVAHRRGYRQALHTAGLAVDEALMAVGAGSEAGGAEAVLRLLPHAPDAIFIASDLMARGALRLLHRSGRRVPGDIALVGYGDLDLADGAIPALTTFRPPLERLGALAVETVLDLLDRGPLPPRRLRLPAELVIRASCGATPEAPRGEGC